MKTRIYHIRFEDTDWLIRAPNSAQAIACVVEGSFTVEVAPQETLASLIQAGVKIEDAKPAKRQASSGATNPVPLTTANEPPAVEGSAAPHQQDDLLTGGELKPLPDGVGIRRDHEMEIPASMDRRVPRPEA